MLRSLVLLPVAATFLAAPEAAAGTFTDQRTGCQFIYDWDDPDSVEWDGPCVDGKAEGEGQLRWYAGSDLIWVSEVKRESGFIIRDGTYEPIIEPSDLEMKVECQVGATTVRVTVDERIDIEHYSTSSHLLRLGRDHGFQKCNATGEKMARNNIAVTLDHHGVEPSKYVHSANIRAYWNRPNLEEMQQFSNRHGAQAYKAMKEKAEAKRHAERAERARLEQAAREEESSRKEAERKREAEQARAEQAAKEEAVSAFAEDNGAEMIISMNELQANPFALEGDVVGVEGAFIRMVERDAALFADGAARPILLRDVPSDRFVDQMKAYLLVGEVKGTEEVNVPELGGQVSMPALDYVADCPRAEGCEQ